MLLLLFSIRRIKAKKWPKLIAQYFTAFLLLFTWFQLSWGLNYHKIPLLNQEDKLHYTANDLAVMTRFFAEESNRLHFLLSDNDSLPVLLKGNKQTILNRVEKSTPNHSINGRIKTSLFGLPLSYMGFSGYLNPFTLEAQVNGYIPKINLPVTAAHEMAHQQGYAAEDEANFIGFLRCYNHPDLDIQYAAHLFGLSYTFNELYKVNPDRANEIRCALYPGILENFALASRFWQAYKNPLEPLFKKSYDRYLKANNQPQGIQSYNGVVSLLIAHFKVANNELLFEK